MSIAHYVVRKEERLWEVWLGRRLLSSQPTYEGALNFAEAEAIAGVQRGEPARIMIGTFDGVAVEFPILPPPRSASSEPAWGKQSSWGGE